jgi:hypothetical protein
MNRVLLAKNGKIIGEIREQSGRLALDDKNGNRKGECAPKTNATRDKNGNRVGQGNLLVTLP